ncbi:type III pantothenate kinase [Marinimicrobium koreense]|uniref:Type III pantothenate kinase n=1 Tax=Marinimicrobium koreense TaxID=306545 RepID=A0A3N1NEN6_9GAMM|nr:type III pantothenate kinase [Marinimicrobium koreense]ROQ17142.1 type III pantothenate kinase [Marinimicrobium koreense]
MILEIDWGNSRIKWRLQGESGTLAAGADAGKDLETVSSSVQDALPAGVVPDTVRVASVRPAADEARLVQWAQSQWRLTPWFARSLAECAGVVSAYSRPGRLGVDRWLALLAARQVSREAAVIVQAGTALTADLLDERGVHRGGYIAPGWQTMRRALDVGTARVRSLQGPPERLQLAPANNTEGAVEAALSAMVVGFVQNACQQLERSSRLIVAGGDAGLIGTHFSQARLWQEIVLDGLAVAYRAETGA